MYMYIYAVCLNILYKVTLKTFAAWMR